MTSEATEAFVWGVAARNERPGCRQSTLSGTTAPPMTKHWTAGAE